jgi:hypothetical protein
MLPADGDRSYMAGIEKLFILTLLRNISCEETIIAIDTNLLAKDTEAHVLSLFIIFIITQWFLVQHILVDIRILHR